MAVVVVVGVVAAAGVMGAEGPWLPACAHVTRVRGGGVRFLERMKARASVAWLDRMHTTTTLIRSAGISAFCVWPTARPCAHVKGAVSGPHAPDCLVLTTRTPTHDRVEMKNEAAPRVRSYLFVS